MTISGLLSQRWGNNDCKSTIADTWRVQRGLLAYVRITMGKIHCELSGTGHMQELTLGVRGAPVARPLPNPKAPSCSAATVGAAKNVASPAKKPLAH